MSTIVDQVSEAISDVTTAIANVNVSDIHASEEPATSDETKDPTLASAEEGRRLYIGNLAYATTEGELLTFFDGYLIESISIPKNPRTDRPVGYAFVDLATPSEAERAITELSGKGILERKVSVQLARKPEPIVEKSATNGTEGTTGTEPEGGRRKMSGRGRGRGRARNGRAPRHNYSSNTETNIEETTVDAVAQTQSEENEYQGTNDTKETKEPKEKFTRPPRERHERGPPADGIPSKTKVMVANLPYDLSEDKLKELFAEYEPVTAKIALRPIPRYMVKKLLARNEPRKGRGFGFVTLGSHELQERAVAEMNGKEIEGREIAVKIAIDSPDKIPEEASAQPTETPDDKPNDTLENEGVSSDPEGPNDTVDNAVTTEAAG